MKSLRAVLAGILIAATFVSAAQQSNVGGNTQRPKFAAVGIGMAAPSGTGRLYISDANPLLSFIESDQASGSQSSRFQVNSAELRYQICDDTFSACATTPLQVSRAGLTTLSTLSSGEATFTGSNPSITASATIPVLRFNETDGTANNRMWRFYANTDDFYADVSNDAGSAVQTWLQVQRTANVVDSIALSASAVTVNGSAVLTAATNPAVPISCAAACNISSIAVGQSAIISGAGLSSINSTVSLTMNSEYQFTNPGSNRYEIHGCWRFNAITTAGMGAVFEFGQSSGSTAGVFSWNANVNAAATSGNGAVDNTFATFATLSTTTDADRVCIDGFFNGNSQTIGLLWAQNSSGPNNIQIGAGDGWFKVTRIQ